AFRDAMTTVAKRGAAQAAAELDDDADQEPDKPRAHRHARDIADQEAAAKQADRIFHGYSPFGPTDPRGDTRPPTTGEQILARRIGKALRRAQYRDRARRVTAST